MFSIFDYTFPDPVCKLKHSGYQFYPDAKKYASNEDKPWHIADIRVILCKKQHKLPVFLCKNKHF